MANIISWREKNKLINSLAVYVASTETFHSYNYKNAI